MPTEPQPAAPDSSNPRSDNRTENTRRRLLDATFQRLAREGYASLSLREIGRDAGINHALISYHFGSKDELVIAVLDDLNARLLDRQKRMYEKPALSRTSGDKRFASTTSISVPDSSAS